MIYLDHAATSFPKPPEVIEAVVAFMREVGANPGRSGHRASTAAARVVFETRSALAGLLGAGDARRVVFTRNATEALNLALRGSLRPGDHVVTTSMEHNAVARPLRRLERTLGLMVTVVAAGEDGRVDPARLGAAVTAETRLVVVNHASNVCGALLDLDEVRREIGPALLLADASQTAGVVPIDCERTGIDLLAFTGHKSLLGPQGTGGLVIGPRFTPEPLILGGTGSGSAAAEQPDFLPDRLESGTANGPGIAGLGAGVRFVASRGVLELRRHELGLWERLRQGLAAIERVTLYGPSAPEHRVAVEAFNIRGLAPSEVAYRLDRSFDILVRGGLHCAPWAHRTLGTMPQGAVRLAPGWANTMEEMDRVIEAVGALAREVA